MEFHTRYFGRILMVDFFLFPLFHLGNIQHKAAGKFIKLHIPPDFSGHILFYTGQLLCVFLLFKELLQRIPSVSSASFMVNRHLFSRRSRHSQPMTVPCTTIPPCSSRIVLISDIIFPLICDLPEKGCRPFSSLRKRIIGKRKQEARSLKTAIRSKKKCLPFEKVQACLPLAELQL